MPAVKRGLHDQEFFALPLVKHLIWDYTCSGVEMNTITITLPDDKWAQLIETANQLGVAPEELARASVEDLLTMPEAMLRRVLENVLKKNAELYRQLAAL